MYENSSEKHESQTRCRSALTPVRSVTSSTDVQKQVGQTRVQFVHARQRDATSSQCGDSTFAYSRYLSPSVWSARPIRPDASVMTRSATATSSVVACLLYTSP